MQRAAINSLRPKQSKSLCFCSQYPEGELHIKLLFTAPNADFCHPACKAIYSKSSQTFPQLSTVFPTRSVFFYVRYLCFSLLYSWVCPPALPASCRRIFQLSGVLTFNVCFIYRFFMRSVQFAHKGGGYAVRGSRPCLSLTNIMFNLIIYKAPDLFHYQLSAHDLAALINDLACWWIDLCCKYWRSLIRI